MRYMLAWLLGVPGVVILVWLFVRPRALSRRAAGRVPVTSRTSPRRARE
jgi:hypothetical protein